MPYNPEIHHRHSIRLKGYDYSQAGAYFITICTQDRKCLFGDVKDRKLILNDAGQMVKKVWDELSLNYLGVKIDHFVIMPNHIHGIIFLSVEAGPCACPDTKEFKGQPQGFAPTKISLFDAVHRFKSFSTTKYKIGVKQYNWQPFRGKLWQRNYYEHILRSEKELNQIREYILNNPLQWPEDEYNAENVGNDGEKKFANKIK